MAAAVAAALVLVSGCRADGGEDPAGDGGEGAAVHGLPPELERDPPRAFSAGPVHELEADEFTPTPEGTVFSHAVVGGRVSVRETDLFTGQARWRTDFPLASSGEARVPADAVAGAPRYGDVGEERFVFSAYRFLEAGAGPEPDAFEIRVLAVSRSHSLRGWEWSLDVEADAASGAVVVAANAAWLVVEVDAGGGGHAFVLDVGDGGVAWSSARVRPLGLDGDVVVGARAGEERAGARLVGVDARTGREVWESQVYAPSEPTAPARPQRTAGGPLSGGAGVVQATGVFDGADGGPRTRFLDAQTGRVRADLPGALRCVHDTEAVVLCQAAAGSNGEGALSAYDADSFEVLWSMDGAEGAEGGSVPEVTAARKGYAYARTADGPVLLDARTGEVVSAGLSVAPDAVTAGFGFRGGSVFAATE